MSSQNIEDFLTKQVLIDGHIVTYRSLSRQFSLHVNAAKNALAAFYVKSRSESKLVATYLVSGEVELDPQASDNMDIDDEGAPKDPEYEDDGAEEVQATEVVLVGEKDLEHTKSKFSTVFMVHVYSLSPAPIRDIGLICGPNEDVRKIDTQKGSEIAAKVGKIVGGDVKEVKGKYIPPPPAATTSGSSSTTKASSNVSSAIKRTGSTANITSDSKPKAIGLAGFFAKAGDTKGKKDATKGKEPKKPVKETAAKAKPASKDSEMEDNSSKASSKVKVKDSDTEGKSTAKTTSKRKQQESLSESDNEMSKPTTTTSKLKAKPPIRKGGTKRKSNVLLSESEDEEEPQKPPSGAESKGIVKKGQVVTNSEEESAPKASRAKDKGKGKQVVKEEDADVLAMMDVDDSMSSYERLASSTDQPTSI
ncbi:DNA polymerase subunit Cdc27 [Rhodocollybia butyracea]|uniref:DNA polymerase delta subunit 3 n=1 Tax=Rhodocollybia butyracea TaxID=206335 RepID=A0A9P5PYQ1_9AGAR|nr:DNA polymerase subunit Cdc27 [Rhodocollybia butyracea]